MLVLSLCTSAHAKWEQQDFLQALKNTKASVQAKEKAQKYNYLFISGFLNEFLPAYFYENQYYLKQIGVDESQIHVFYPPSNSTLFASADLIASQLKTLKRQNNKPWILIAHSKGGFEALLFAAKYKDLFLENVKRLHIVQGAFGTPISDYANGGGHAIDNQLDFSVSWTCKLNLGLRFLLDSKINKGLYALTTEKTEETLRHLFKNYGNNIKSVKSRIHYTITTTTSEQATLTLYCPSNYLETYYGESDGLIPKEQQWVEGTGTIWADLQLDHTDTMLSFPISNTLYTYRYAFTKLIIEDL